MRILNMSMAGLLLAALVGCVSTQQHQNVEFRLQKVESERDNCRQSLISERAQVAALNERLSAERRKAASAQAQTSIFQERIVQLQRKNKELENLFETRAAAPLRRPEVPISPLPPELDQALRQFAEKFQARVWYERQRGAVSFANDRLFEPGSDVVRADAHAALHEFAAIASRALPEQYELNIVGHTDDTPIRKPETLARHPTNWHLSVHRAIAVKDVLGQAGLPASRLGVMGYGQYRPVSDDHARNRRVEIFLVRKGQAQSLAPVRPPGR